MAKKKVEPEAPVVVEEPAPVVEEHPQVRPLGDGRWVERRYDHERTVVIHGDRYEHVTEDADGHWVYARS